MSLSFERWKAEIQSADWHKRGFIFKRAAWRWLSVTERRKWRHPVTAVRFDWELLLAGCWVSRTNACFCSQRSSNCVERGRGGAAKNRSLSVRGAAWPGPVSAKSAFEFPMSHKTANIHRQRANIFLALKNWLWVYVAGFFFCCLFFFN